MVRLAGRPFADREGGERGEDGEEDLVCRILRGLLSGKEDDEKLDGGEGMVESWS